MAEERAKGKQRKQPADPPENHWNPFTRPDPDMRARKRSRFLREIMTSRIFIVTGLCILGTVIVSGYTLYRTSIPSEGKPYERLTVEEAQSYMSFEENFVIADVRPEKDYLAGHIQDARSLPYNQIVENAEDLLPDMGQMIYVYGASSEESCRAAQKLSDMGYTNIAEIGDYDSWIMESSITETEGFLQNRIDDI